eukprot:4868-Amorphochlora_amoeboformis.AAC.1
MATYLEFKPHKLKDWCSLLSFWKGTVKLLFSILLDPHANSFNTNNFNSAAFTYFSSTGGTTKIIQIQKWLLNIPRKLGETARITYFQKNPWGITDKITVNFKTINAAQALLVEIGNFICSLSEYRPKSSICLELIKNGVTSTSFAHGEQEEKFLTSVVKTASRLLENRSNASGKKQHNEEDLKKLVNMGFGRARSLRALRQHRYKFVRAMEWLLGNNHTSPLLD